jgi:hypothetical protein
VGEEFEVGLVLVVVLRGLVEVWDQRAAVGRAVEVGFYVGGDEAGGVLDVEVGFDAAVSSSLIQDSA